MNHACPKWGVHQNHIEKQAAVLPNMYLPALHSSEKTMDSGCLNSTICPARFV